MTPVFLYVDSFLYQFSPFTQKKKKKKKSEREKFFCFRFFDSRRLKFMHLAAEIDKQLSFQKVHST